MKTRTLPTDKHGQIYYGPRTEKEGVEAVEDFDAPPAEVVAQMRRAGFNRAASAIAKRYPADMRKNEK